jgi:hypothetical protein
MSLFCLLWTPLFYLFRKAVISEGNAGFGGVWALLLGSVWALTRFFLGSLVDPGGFGLSRWINACIDIVSLPAVLPLAVYFLFLCLRIVSDSADFTGFTLLWLIPEGVMRAVSWSAQRDPALLVLVPVLWTAIAVGIPFFIRIIPETRNFGIVLAVLGALALPFLAAAVYWAFFAQKLPLGFVLLFITIIPAGTSIGIAFYQGKG